MLQIEVRNVYGVAKAYPANLLAKQFAGLVGTTTLTRGTLCRILAMGFEVEVVGHAAAVYSASTAQHLPVAP